jgi:hypothetical protein
VRSSGNEIDVRAGWNSNSCSGDSRFIFLPAGHTIREMRITNDK